MVNPLANARQVVTDEVPFRLDPQPDHSSTLLPPADTPVGAVPSTADSVVQVYPDAIAFGSQQEVLRGLLGTIGAIGIPLTGYLIYETLLMEDVAWFFIFCLLVMFFLSWTTLRVDLNGFRSTPVLLSRTAGKVHVFEEVGFDFFAFWKLWGGHKYVIHTYDWDCVRAEIAQVMVESGNGIRAETGLVFAITETPGSHLVKARFGVGTTSAYDGGRAMLGRWEHIRRFMRREAPLMQPGDKLFADWGVTFWEALFSLQPLLGPGSGEYWKSGKWYIYLAGVWILPLLPYTMFAGLMRWLSYVLKVEPKWPDSILASIGGEPLSREEIEQLTHVIPGPRKQVQAGKRRKSKGLSKETPRIE